MKSTNLKIPVKSALITLALAASTASFSQDNEISLIEFCGVKPIPKPSSEINDLQNKISLEELESLQQRVIECCVLATECSCW